MITREKSESLKGDAVDAQPCKHTQVLAILKAICLHIQKTENRSKRELF